MRPLASLRSRVLVVTVALTVLTVLTTAWAVSRSVDQALRTQAARSLSNDTDIYQALLDYGTTHTSWDDVGPTVADLATRYDRRVALQDDTGRVLVDSSVLLGHRDGPLRPRPDAVIDPYSPGTGSTAPGSLAQAVAPAQPTPSAADLAQNAQRVQTASACLRMAGVPFRVEDVGDGTRTVIPGDGLTDAQQQEADRCTDPLFAPTASQRAAIDAQNTSIAACLDRAGTAHRLIDDGYAPAVTVDTDDPAATAALDRCTEQAQRAGLAPRVSLFLGSSETAALRWDRLTTGSTLAVIAAIIAVAGGVALVSALAITRPLRRLAAAAGRITDGDFDTRVPASGRGEVAQVGLAFNTMAEALDRTEAQRRRMVSDIAHELRNPLVTLGGTLEAIQDEVFEASPEVIASLAEEARQLSHLVNDLAELNAAESGHLRLARAQVDLAAVARTVVDAHSALARAAGLTLRLDEQLDQPSGCGSALVVGDEVRLRQVLTNLVSNALRYSTPGGTVTVSTTVSTTTTTTTGTAVEVRVVDQGVGITPEQLPLVFDRFWRADAARARATGGTGLGLAISRELVHAHHGELTVTSQVGVGTEFVVRLPAAT